MTEPGSGFLAEVELPLRGQPLSKASGLLISDFFLIGAVTLTLLLLLLVWARYLRNLRFNKQRSGGQKVYRDPSITKEEELLEEAQAEARRRYKYRYRRRTHRSRNPTLAETGGLPPERAENT